MDQGLPAQLLEVLDTSNHEDFKKKADIVSGLLKAKSASNVNNATLAEMKLRIAYEKGIPAEMAPRLMGETEAEIYKDADAVLGITRVLKGPAPLFDPESGRIDFDGSGFRNTKHTPKQY